jgi:hypothetical protein
MRRNIRLQSAMEYLMTYGWSILIIAVVLGVLFQLGVFSSSSFSIKSPPGACKVFRAAGTSSLVGQCSGLMPQYVAKFDGSSSYVFIPDSASLDPTQAMTFAIWFSASNTVSSWAMGKGSQFGTYVDGAHVHGIFGNTLGQQWTDWNPQGVASNTWVQYAETYSVQSGSILAYFNGAYYETIPMLGPILPSTYGFAIGAGFWGGPTSYTSGYIADVQVYNISLSANEIQSLYNEGIGGAPVRPQNIVGWWPLNGDTKDYSGSNNHGIPTSLSYTSQYGK